MRLVYFANDKSRNHFYLKNHGPLCARSVFSKGLDKRTNINVMLKYRSPFKLGLSGRDAAGHYPTRATRPVTRPALNRANYPYYP